MPPIPRPHPFLPPLMAILLASGVAHAQPAPPAPRAPRGPDAPAPMTIETERIERDFAGSMREIEREIEREIRHAFVGVEALHWNALAQAGGFDADPDSTSPSFAFIAREFGGGREIVKNAPYSAEAVNETVQTLADGNRIVHRSSVMVARDGYGRTRQEKKGGAVYLFDPIAERSYALDPERRTVARIPRAPMLAAPPAPPAQPAPPAGTAPPPPPGAVGPPPAAAAARETQRIVVKRAPDGKEVEVAPSRVVVRRSGDADAPRHEEVHVEVIRIGRDGAPPRDALAPLPPLALPLLPRGKGETKSLGMREIDGVKADGTMTTHTIPAGEIGNEKPIVVMSERWFSPELHVVVYAKHSDPRTGDTIYRLANLKRGEPPAELFKVPADYRPKGDARRP
ncbi:MAG: hypothetical protein U1F51_09125 [Burkholderiales bacterium]